MALSNDPTKYPPHFHEILQTFGGATADAAALKVLLPTRGAALTFRNKTYKLSSIYKKEMEKHRLRNLKLKDKNPMEKSINLKANGLRYITVRLYAYQNPKLTPFDINFTGSKTPPEEHIIAGDLNELFDKSLKALPHVLDFCPMKETPDALLAPELDLNYAKAMAKINRSDPKETLREFQRGRGVATEGSLSNEQLEELLRQADAGELNQPEAVELYKPSTPHSETPLMPHQVKQLKEEQDLEDKAKHSAAQNFSTGNPMYDMD